MIDLGKYAGAVLGAYGASFALLGGLIWWTLAKGRATRLALETQEKKPALEAQERKQEAKNG